MNVLRSQAAVVIKIIDVAKVVDAINVAETTHF